MFEDGQSKDKEKRLRYHNIVPEQKENFLYDELESIIVAGQGPVRVPS